jgi:hypothetical protein
MKQRRSEGGRSEDYWRKRGLGRVKKKGQQIAKGERPDRGESSSFGEERILGKRQKEREERRTLWLRAFAMF